MLHLPSPPSRSPQAAKTYMERQFESFAGASLDGLVKHALHALQASLQARRGRVWLLLRAGALRAWLAALRCCTRRRPRRRCVCACRVAALAAWLAVFVLVCCGLPPAAAAAAAGPPAARAGVPDPGPRHAPPPPQDGELTDKNCSVAVVGKGMPFTLLEDEALEPYITGGSRGGGGGGHGGGGGGGGWGVMVVVVVEPGCGLDSGARGSGVACPVKGRGGG